VFDTKAECSQCVLSRPCVRCARVGRPVGKLTVYGPACNSCAHYFNDPEPCDRCASLSTRLVCTKIDDRVMRCCPRCARINERTCPQCRRHRLLELQVDGKEICRRCAQSPASRCSGCDGEIPGGRGKECEDCYWSRTFQKRLMLDATALRNQLVVSDFTAFGSWLASEKGSKRAALSIHGYLDFFLMLDEKFAGMPTPEQLLQQIGCDGLRQARVPIRWFKSARSYVIDDVLLEQYVEDERLRKTMALMSSVADSELLDDYLTTLQLRVKTGDLKRPSLRGKLNAAADLVLLARSEGMPVIEQSHIDRLLKIKPGIANNLWGFVTFCNARWTGRQALAVDKSKAEASRRSKLETQMIKLAIAANSGHDVQRSWITKSLAYFHRLRTAHLNAALTSPDPAGNGWVVDVEGVSYWVPDPCHLSLVQTVERSEN
jgi:hypothetical protein